MGIGHGARRRQGRVGSGILAAPGRSDLGWWGSVVLALLILFLAVVVVAGTRRPPRHTLNQDPTVRLMEPVHPGNCAVERRTGKAVGTIVGVLGRDGKPLLYRIQDFTGDRRGRSAAFPFDMPIAEVSVVRCAQVGR
jgi:hypothetical protein